MQIRWGLGLGLGLGLGRTATFAVGVARKFLPRHRTQQQLDAVR